MHSLAICGVPTGCNDGCDSGTETEEAIQKRLGNAKEEMDFGAAPGNFDTGSAIHPRRCSFAPLTACPPRRSGRQR